MEELIEKMENLKETLNQTEPVQKLKEKQQEVYGDQELLNDIEEYKKTGKESLKEKIEKNPLYREYKHQETECNLLIMRINQRLKEIKDKGSCNK